MTNTAEALQFIESLTKQGIKKRAATDIVNFVEKQRGDLVIKQDLEPINQKLEWLKWIVGIGFTIGFGLLLTVMLYLHSNTKAEINKLEEKMDQRIDRLEKKIDQLLERGQR